VASGGSDRERKTHLLGWVIFIVCAGFFIASSVGGSVLGVVGSVLFLIACLVFIAPLVTRSRKGSED
jgi:hypothetical protein